MVSLHPVTKENVIFTGKITFCIQSLFHKKYHSTVHTFTLDSSMSTSKFDVSDGLLTSGIYGGTAEKETTMNVLRERTDKEYYMIHRHVTSSVPVISTVLLA